MDHDYIINQNNYTFSNFSKEIIIYIAGFAVHKLTSVLYCETCISALCSTNKADFLNFWITFKNKDGNRDGFSCPSDDVILICFETKKVLKFYNYQNKANINY